MTMQNLNASPTYIGAGRWNKLAALVSPDRMVAALGRYRTYRRTVSELEACCDRELSDLGIARYDIPRLAREAAYGE